MNYYARLIKGRVTEVWNDGGLNITPADVHVAELATKFVPCPDWVIAGATYDGKEWVNPEPILPTEPTEEPEA
ncbi:MULTISPECIES: hypothetical protein [Aeromonas]|nr:MULTISPECIES: hypothetical protein [Aeromonas]MBL0674498.1 hypothetical protein [Aeromonas dhakensis]MBL0677654.1 hypothetical protein [Aeromonas dhakensis]QMS75111.1 hypothetical protein M001_013480 [Aeromonas veronii Hm21]